MVGLGRCACASALGCGCGAADRHGRGLDTIATLELGDHGYAEFLSEVDSVIMGATTYEQDLSRGGWPYGSRPTWVFTHRSLSTPGDAPSNATVRFVDGAVSHHIPEIRKTTERAAYLVGGALLVEQFMEAGAIDQLRLFVVPLILGKGIRLFESSEPTSAELLGTRSFPTGLVELRYRLALGHLLEPFRAGLEDRAPRRRRIRRKA